MESDDKEKVVPETDRGGVKDVDQIEVEDNPESEEVDGEEADPDEDTDSSRKSEGATPRSARTTRFRWRMNARPRTQLRDNSEAVGKEMSSLTRHLRLAMERRFDEEIGGDGIDGALESAACRMSRELEIRIPRSMSASSPLSKLIYLVFRVHATMAIETGMLEDGLPMDNEAFL